MKLHFNWGWLSRWAYGCHGWRPIVIDPPPTRAHAYRAPRVIFINASPVRRAKGQSGTQRRALKRRAFVHALRRP